VAPLKTILVTGYAQAPKGTVMHERYKLAGVVLEVDSASGAIVAADATLVTALARDFFQRCVVGYDLSQGPEGLVQRIVAHFASPSRDALAVALRAAAQRFAEHRPVQDRGGARKAKP
jgi:hypothetical protein